MVSITRLRNAPRLLGEEDILSNVPVRKDIYLNLRSESFSDRLLSNRT